MAVLPSALMRVLPAREKGPMTLETWAVWVMSLSEAWTARLLAASVSVPRDAWKTIGLCPFCCGGNSRLRRSEARWASVPGSLMSLFVRAPNTSTPAATAATTNAQTNRARYLRLTHTAPRR